MGAQRTRLRFEALRRRGLASHHHVGNLQCFHQFMDHRSAHGALRVCSINAGVTKPAGKQQRARMSLMPPGLGAIATANQRLHSSPRELRHCVHRFFPLSLVVSALLLARLSRVRHRPVGHAARSLADGSVLHRLGDGWVEHVSMIDHCGRSRCSSPFRHFAGTSLVAIRKLTRSKSTTLRPTPGPSCRACLRPLTSTRLSRAAVRSMSPAPVPPPMLSGASPRSVAMMRHIRICSLHN